jgi:NitT/TauT family transport system permease protein
MKSNILTKKTNPVKFINLYRVLPIAILLVFWQFLTWKDPALTFFFGSPGRIGNYLVEKMLDGSLPRDIAVTFIEATLGFILGNVVGTAIGLGLWYSKLAIAIAKPYVIVLGSAPIFALAPLLIIWFGTGLFSKVMIAALSTVFVALMQSYTGASEVSNDYLRLMRTFGATQGQTFRKVVAPSSIVWVISAFKLNVGFAILGAFIGEFVSSNAGLGHLILVASGLFDISLVLCGVILLAGLAFVLYFLVGQLEPRLKKFVVSYL